MKTEAPFLISIDNVAFPNNYGVGRKEHLVVFVPDTVPGDKAQVRIVKTEKGLAYGELVCLEEPSPFRVEAPCTHFGSCGGCSLQNLSYQTQLHLKEDHLFQTLRRLGKITVPENLRTSVTPSPAISFYRNKLELAFGQEGDRTILGLRERALPFKPYKARVIPLTECPVFSPALHSIIILIQDFVNEQHLSSYNPLTRKGLLRHLIIRESKSTGEMLLSLETRPGRLPDLSSLWQALLQAVPGMTGFYHLANNNRADFIRYTQARHLFGKAFVEESIQGLTFRVYPHSFFQPNTGAAGLLYAHIAASARLTGTEHVLGLYCGSGALEIFLSSFVKKVTGIDSVEENIKAARENCAINRVENASFLAGKVEEILPANSYRPIDLIIVDPPRAGITPEGLKMIVDLSAPKLVYVSCNPATLARDLRYLYEKGYEIMSIAPFDFFPHTSHLETLVVLNKTGD